MSVEVLVLVTRLLVFILTGVLAKVVWREVQEFEIDKKFKRKIKRSLNYIVLIQILWGVAEVAVFLLENGIISGVGV